MKFNQRFKFAINRISLNFELYRSSSVLFSRISSLSCCWSASRCLDEDLMAFRDAIAYITQYSDIYTNHCKNQQLDFIPLRRYGNSTLHGNLQLFRDSSATFLNVFEANTVYTHS